MKMMKDEFMEMMKKQNKRFKRDCELAIIMMAWSVPFAAWCIAQIIKGCHQDMNELEKAHKILDFIFYVTVAWGLFTAIICLISIVIR